MKALAGTAILTFVSCAAGQSPGFHLVGFAPDGTSSVVSGLSQDGSIAVGSSTTPTRIVVFRWTAAGGREDIGLHPGMPTNTSARAVSSDGSIIAGVGPGPFGAWSAARITGGSFLDLGIFPNHNTSSAEGVSGDGTVLVGTCSGNRGLTSWQTPFHWTAQTGMQPLGGETWFTDHAEGISRDGATVVGWGVYAWRWTQAGGRAQLGGLSQATGTTQAHAVNADGSIIVGYSSSPSHSNQTHAVRWVAGVVEDLGVLPGTTRSYGHVVNDDGSVVGGYCPVPGPSEIAFVWTPGTGMLRLDDHLTSRGVAIPAGWTLRQVLAISGDGLTFGGIAQSPEGVRQGFVATIAGHCYPNCDNSTTAPILNVADFICFTNKFAAADPYANCDNSTVPPVLNVADFVCFQTRFAAGCQ